MDALKLVLLVGLGWFGLAVVGFVLVYPLFCSSRIADDARDNEGFDDLLPESSKDEPVRGRYDEEGLLRRTLPIWRVASGVVRPARAAPSARPGLGRFVASRAAVAARAKSNGWPTSATNLAFATFAAGQTVAVADRYAVTMLLLHHGTPRDQEAREQLAAVLPEAEVEEADDVGIFDVVLEADDLEEALKRVWNAVAASGTDDHIIFLEHPELPEHWRPRSGRPTT